MARFAGATIEWIRWNTSWGNEESSTPLERHTRALLLDAPRVKVGKGTQTRVDLTPEEAAEVYDILDSIAAAGESMTAGERGDDAYTYRTLRRDAERLL